MDSKMLDGYIRSAENDLSFKLAKLESELQWVDSEVASIRRNAAAGQFYGELNIISRASEVARRAIQLQDATERIESLKHIRDSA